MNLQALKKFVENRKSARQPWDSLYQDVADCMIPRKAEFTTKHRKGNRQERRIFEDTGPWALEQFANGLHAYLTSPQSRWFSTQIKDAEQRQNTEILAWQDAVLSVLYDQFNSAASSFHPTVQEVYTDMGAFGYGVGYSEWNEEDRSVQFQSRFPGECYLWEDMYGRVRGVVRCYSMEADDFATAYGVEKMKAADQRLYNEGKLTKTFPISHIVLPVTHALMKDFKFKSGHQYGSIRICAEVEGELLSEGGFRTFPFHIPRWSKRAGDVYPSSPGITALPSVQRANVIALDLIKIANRWGDPPTQGPDDEELAPYDLSPGAQNYYRPGTNDRIEGITGVLGDPSWAERILDMTKESIMRQFFVDAFLTTADSNGQNVKATFVAQRRDERFRQLSAMLSRVEREFLSSLVERTFDLAQEHGLIPEAPAEIELEIEYLSPIVRAQRAEQLDGLYPLIELSGVGAQYDPSVMETFDWDNIIRDAGEDIYALPSRWFKSREDVAQSRQAAKQMQELQAGSEVAQGLSGALKNVADANLNPDR